MFPRELFRLHLELERERFPHTMVYRRRRKSRGLPRNIWPVLFLCAVY